MSDSLQYPTPKSDAAAHFVSTMPPYCEPCEEGGPKGEFVPIEVARELEQEVQHIKALLQNPTAVHVNMLRGTIAKPAVSNIVHLYADAIVPIEAVNEAAPILERVGYAGSDRYYQQSQSWLKKYSPHLAD